jgi:hypothetical protein
MRGQEHDEPDGRGEPRDEVRVVERSGRELRPQAPLGEDAERDRESTERRQGRGAPPEKRTRHDFRERERTKATTADARAGGTSEGLSICRVLPVAR